MASKRAQLQRRAINVVVMPMLQVCCGFHLCESVCLSANNSNNTLKEGFLSTSPLNVKHRSSLPSSVQRVVY